MEKNKKHQDQSTKEISFFNFINYKSILLIVFLFSLNSQAQNIISNNSNLSARSVLVDYDSDGIDDRFDIDDDNDGIPDVLECGQISRWNVLTNSTSTNHVNIATLTGVTKTANLSVTSASGTLSMTSQTPKETIQISEASSGVYIINSSEPLSSISIYIVSIQNSGLTNDTAFGNFKFTLQDGTIITNPAFIIDNNYYGYAGVSGGNTEIIQTTTIGGVNYVHDPTNNGGNDQAVGSVLFPSTFGIPLFSKGIVRIEFNVIGTDTGSNKCDFGIIGSVLEDFDGDNINNCYDLDSDNDGIYDVVEGGDGNLDTNIDGVINNLDTGFADGNTNGMADASESTAPTNTNGGIYINAQQLDSDNDGCFDVNEAGFTDNNADGILGNAPVSVNANGVVTSGVNGYTLPNSNTYLTAFPINITTQPINKNICELQTTSFTVSHSASVTQWQVSTNNGATWNNVINGPNYSGSQTTTLTISNTPLSFNGYLYRAVIGSVCTSNSNTALLTVNAAVNAPVSIGNITVCENGTSQTLNANTQITPITGQTIIWYNALIGGNVVSNPTLTSTTAATITYYASATSSTIPCESVRTAVTLTIKATPTVTATPNTQTFCTNTSTNIALSSNVVGTTFAWTVAQTNVSGASNGTGSSISQLLTNTGTTTGTAVYTITPTANGCTGASIVVTINVTPNLLPTFVFETTYCMGETPNTLPTISSSNTVEGFWTPSAINTNITGYSNYTFTSTNTCQVTNTVVPVFVETPVTPTFNAILGLCQNSNNKELPTKSLENITGTWDVSEINTNNLGITSYIFTPNSGFCSTTGTLSVEVVSCSIPKGVSPNNDGKNDTFDLSNFNVRKLEIFNRYGIKLFSKDNYTNDWFGQADNGNELPSGTYYYVIDFDDRATESGWVYVNR